MRYRRKISSSQIAGIGTVATRGRCGEGQTLTVTECFEAQTPGNLVERFTANLITWQLTTRTKGPNFSFVPRTPTAGGEGPETQRGGILAQNHDEPRRGRWWVRDYVPHYTRPPELEVPHEIREEWTGPSMG